MKEEDPLKSQELDDNLKIDLSTNSSFQNINYDKAQPLPLPPMKNIHKFIMNCVKNEEY